MTPGFLFAVVFMVIVIGGGTHFFAPWWNRRQGVDGKGNPLKGASQN